MKEERFLELFGQIDPKYIEEAEPMMKTSRKRIWISIGAAAACLCMIVTGTVLASRHTAPGGDLVQGGVEAGGGAGVEAGGSELSDCGDYSVAVFPASEKKENVATAEANKVTEAEALAGPLGAWLPGALPEGYHFGRGTLYETVMKDGTVYRMLRVEYLTGVIPEQQFTEDGGAIAPDPSVFGDTLQLILWSFTPDARYPIVTPEAAAQWQPEEGALYLRLSDTPEAVARIEGNVPEAALALLQSLLK